jgi:hypothetical protein
MPRTGALAGITSPSPDPLNCSESMARGDVPSSPISGRAANLYPTPCTQMMNCGAFGFGSILRRSRAMSMSTLRSKGSAPCPTTA